MDERKFLSRWVDTPNYSAQHAPVCFRPDSSIKWNECSKYWKSVFFSQFQQIRTFYQIQSFQNDFKLHHNQLLFVKLISGYMNLMFQRHVSEIGVISLWKYNILYRMNCLIWDRYFLIDIILFELIRISLIILISLSMNFDKFLYRKSKFLNYLPFMDMIEKMNRENTTKSN